MTQKPCVLCCAITGSVATKADNPAVPTSIQEQIESSHAAVEAGASIIHAHVRNDDQRPSSDPVKFAALKEGLEKHCPGVVIQFSTGGRSGAGQARGGMLSLMPFRSVLLEAAVADVLGTLSVVVPVNFIRPMSTLKASATIWAILVCSPCPISVPPWLSWIDPSL